MFAPSVDRHGLLALCLVLTAAAATFLGGPASAESETRATAPFHAVTFAGSWNVDVTVGKEASVVIAGRKDVISRVKTEVVNGELRIGLDSSGLSSLFKHDLGDLTAHITTPDLTTFALEGSGKANISGLSGAPNIVLKGSGDIVAKGKVDSLTLVVHGSGTADLSGLEAARASATINGSGDATVDPREALVAVVNGSGQVNYLREGVKVTSVIHGSGTVERK
jgi:hypothetical protein